MIYGYARVSTDGQSVADRVKQLEAVGCAKVYRETASGAQTDRAQLQRALSQLEAGDVLMVTRLDRLARSTRDLLNTMHAITAKKAGIRSMNEGWADTTSSLGRMLVTFLGGVAEYERELILARTAEGRARAKERGQSLGRRHSMTLHQRREARQRKQAGEPVREIARSYNVSASTISRLPA